jgi:hypothetical protein
MGAVDGRLDHSCNAHGQRVARHLARSKHQHVWEFPILVAPCALCDLVTIGRHPCGPLHLHKEWTIAARPWRRLTRTRTNAAWPRINLRAVAVRQSHYSLRASTGVGQSGDTASMREGTPNSVQAAATASTSWTRLECGCPNNPASLRAHVQGAGLTSNILLLRRTLRASDGSGRRECRARPA